MNSCFTLKRETDGTLRLSKGLEPERRVMSAAQACRRLRRSRRQVYRLMKAGRLGPPAKILGEWLIEEASVESLARAPLAAQPLPGRLKPLFPEYERACLTPAKTTPWS